MKSSGAMHWSSQSPHMSPRNAFRGMAMWWEEKTRTLQSMQQQWRWEGRDLEEGPDWGGWTECGAIWNKTSSTQSSHRTEKDGERQSWRSTPERDKIGKGTQRYAKIRKGTQRYARWSAQPLLVSSSSVGSCISPLPRSSFLIRIVRPDVYQ